MKTFKEFRESIGYSTKLEVVEREKIEIFEGDVIDQLRKIAKSKKEAEQNAALLCLNDNLI